MSCVSKEFGSIALLCLQDIIPLRSCALCVRCVCSVSRQQWTAYLNVDICGVCAIKKSGKSFPLVVGTKQPCQHLASRNGWGKNLFRCVPQPCDGRVLEPRRNGKHLCFSWSVPRFLGAGREAANCVSAHPGRAKPSQLCSCCWCFSRLLGQHWEWVKPTLGVEGLCNCVPNCWQTRTKTVESLVIK